MAFWKRNLLLASMLLFSTASAFAQTASTVEDNKRIVRDFYDMAFNQHKPAEAAAKYLGSVYVQHNPGVGDGADAFVARFEPFFKRFPNSHADIKQVIAEGDLVALHLNSKQDKDDRGRAIVDIFRVQDGKIVEHWDVIQPVPAEPNSSGHGMF